MPIPSPKPSAGAICEGELIQAIGRGRGVNRTAETPLEIDLLTDAVLPLTVQEVAPMVRRSSPPAMTSWRSKA